MMKFPFLGWCGVFLAGSGGLIATEIGDPAPRLEVGEWVKGDPVDLQGEGTNIVVVDFWASWSPICRTTIPRLSHLQRNFKSRGLTIVGIADESPQAIRQYVEKLGDEFDYSVGADLAHGSSESYMVPFKAGGVPHSFIIDREGKIVWHGHPMRGLDQTVLKLLLGKFDPEAARAESAHQKRAQEYLGKARAGANGPAFEELGKSALQEMEGHPEPLNHFAWTILTDERITTRDRDLALAAAKRAYESTSGEVAAVGDTYARALFEKGDVEGAVAKQREALERTDDDRLKSRFKETLAGYLAKLEVSGNAKED